jgi:GTP-binding protein
LFNPAVAAKPQIVVATKIDALDDPSRADRLETHVTPRGLSIYRVSAVTGDGIDALLEATWRQIMAVRQAGPPPEPEVDEETDFITPARRMTRSRTTAAAARSRREV